MLHIDTRAGCQLSETDYQLKGCSDRVRGRRYGEKLVRGSQYARTYYQCGQAGCPARKIVERDPVHGSVSSCIYGVRAGSDCAVSAEHVRAMLGLQMTHEACASMISSC